MNRNQVSTNNWSNIQTAEMYREEWPNEPHLKIQARDLGEQCGGCSFFAKVNEDWGLCCHKQSRHHLETVFEHFTCGSFVDEGWGPHSFSADKEFHCRCGGVADGRIHGQANPPR
jgi:hypothetical protein